MRVIAGRLRHLRLQAPPGRVTRPITDRVKESLFSILGHRLGTPNALPEIDVLDVFAGSGSLGIEALSRGARSCLFVERTPPSVRALRTNLTRLRLTDVGNVLMQDAWTMRAPATAQDGFGLILVDPPYRDAEDPLRVADLLSRLAPRLAPDGIIVFRFNVFTAFPFDQIQPLTCLDDRKFGKMRLVFLGHPSAPGEPSQGLNAHDPRTTRPASPTGK